MSWYNNPVDDFKQYTLHILQDRDEILDAIPSALNCPPKGHGEFIRWLVYRLQPDITVELGVDYGYSACLMAMAQSNPVYGIDCFDPSKHPPRVENDYNYVLQLKQKLQLNNLHIIKDYFDDVAQHWTLPIDLLHIDGLHDYDNIQNDFTKWFPKVTERGVVMLHDTQSWPHGVGRLFNELDYPKLNFNYSNGLGVVSRDRELIQEISQLF